jgi:DNA polymerase-3 subunit beta
MELTINKNEMVKALAKVQSVIESRSSMPILSNVMLSAVDSKLIINATDLESSIEDSLQAKVSKDGKITVPARILYQIIRELPAEEVYLKEKANLQLYISGGKANYNTMGLPVEDFPQMPTIIDAKSVNINSSILKEMIDKTKFSIAEDKNPNLSGLLVQIKKIDEKYVMRFVSTDGHRLSLIDREIDDISNINIDNGALLSRKGVQEMRKMTDEGGDLLFGFTSSFAILQKENTKLVLRLQENTFPDYEAAIPKFTGKIISLGRVDFNEVLKRVSIMAVDNFKEVKLHFKDGVIELSSKNPQIGDSCESFSVDYSGKDFNAAFNYSYFIEVCQAMHSDLLNIAFIDEQNPCVIKGEGDPGFLSIIMPMKI